jgi:hypothetical protein
MTPAELQAMCFEAFMGKAYVPPAKPPVTIDAATAAFGRSIGVLPPPPFHDDPRVAKARADALKAGAALADPEAWADEAAEEVRIALERAVTK